MKKPKDRKSPTPPVIMPVLAEESIFSPVLERRPKISARADAMIPGKHAQENTIPPIPKIMDAFAILLLLSIALLLSFVIILPSSPCLVNRANGQFFVTDHPRVTVQTGLRTHRADRIETQLHRRRESPAPAQSYHKPCAISPSSARIIWTARSTSSSLMPR